MPPPSAKHRPAVKILPASRLPLGTLSVRSASSPSPDSAAGRLHASLRHRNNHSPESESTTPADCDAAMSHQDIVDRQSAAARAQAKLRRQEERIQRQDAALALPSSSAIDKTRPASRGKAKWQPFELSTQTSVPGVEVRVNTYAAPSRKFAPVRRSSLTRSLSSVSQPGSSVTGASGANFGVERQHSSTPDDDDAGFQLYTRRGSQKQTFDPAHRPDRPVDKQNSVEAAYDESEILEVFKQHLPGPDYLKSAEGFEQGEVKFVQHPNGDVSAHKWEKDVLRWLNIGSFSNIRKKIEGQLAGERLKGETAGQKVQQNTLAYFRIAAKQREASEMGKSFTQEDIKEALPELARLGSSDSEIARATLTRPVHSGLLMSGHRYEHQYCRQGAMHKSEDPFSSETPALFNAAISQPALVSSSRNVPSVGPCGLTEWTRIGTSHATGDTASATMGRVQDVNNWWPKIKIASNMNATAQPYQPEHSQMTKPDGTNEHKPEYEVNTPTSRVLAAPPLSVREAMRGQLQRLGDMATKRSLSQANIARTVLNDPLRATDHSEYANEYINRGSTERAVDHDSPVLQRTRDEHGIMDATWGESRLLADRKTSILTLDSVPDTEYRQPAVPDIVSKNHPPGSMHKSPIGSASCNQTLQDWWTGGKKFTRQEEFYRHIIATSKPVNAVSATHRQQTSFGTPISRRSLVPSSSSSSAINTPYSNRDAKASTPPSTNNADPPGFNLHTTRIFIPVYENLASYVQGPANKRRDYWSQWTQPPEWCIDRSPSGNNSFFDNGSWGQPPARVGRDPRYSRSMPNETGSMLRFGGFSPGGSGVIGSPGGAPVSGVAGRRYGYGGGRY